MLQIDKNIPLPAARSAVDKCPWASMEVGDSFLLPGAKVSGCSHAAQANKRYHDKRFVSRQESAGVRIWRVK